MASECAVKLSVQQRRFRRHVRDPAVTVGDVPNAATGTFLKARLESLLCVGRQQLSSPCAVRHSRPRNTGDRWRHNPGINVGSTAGAAAVAAGARIHDNRRLCNFRGWGTVRRCSSTMPRAFHRPPRLRHICGMLFTLTARSRQPGGGVVVHNSVGARTPPRTKSEE